MAFSAELHFTYLNKVFLLVQVFDNFIPICIAFWLLSPYSLSSPSLPSLAGRFCDPFSLTRAIYVTLGLVHMGGARCRVPVDENRKHRLPFPVTYQR